MIVVEDSDIEEYRKHREKFYELIGHYITLYQCVEDYIEEVFVAALGGKKARATAIFETVRGLEAKMALVKACLGDRPAEAKQWSRIQKRIRQAADGRNEIAHARPVSNGGLVSATAPAGPGRPAKLTRVTKARMELRKETRKGVTIWTNELIYEAYCSAEDLMRDQIKFRIGLEAEGSESSLDGCNTA